MFGVCRQKAVTPWLVLPGDPGILVTMRKSPPVSLHVPFLFCLFPLNGWRIGYLAIRSPSPMLSGRSAISYCQTLTCVAGNTPPAVVWTSNRQGLPFKERNTLLCVGELQVSLSYASSDSCKDAYTDLNGTVYFRVVAD